MFTTHTPVRPATTRFPSASSKRIWPGAWGTLGGYRDAFLALGQYDNGSGSLFNMTALALRAAGTVNAVSQLHGQVTRQMWGPIWRNVPDDQRPVRAITNGIHVPTWLSAEMSRLFDDHLGGDWRDRHDDPTVWDRVLEIPDEELWAVRKRCATTCSPSFASARDRAGRKSTSPPPASSRPGRCSIRMRSRSDSRAGSRATSGPS